MKTLYMINSVWILLIGCAPSMTSSGFLYSSESLHHIPNSFVQQNTKGLQEENLEKLFESVNCEDFETKIWHHIYLTLFENSPPPSPVSVKKKIKSYAQDYLSLKGVRPNIIRNFSTHFTKLYETVLTFFADKSKETILEQLVEIDLIDLSRASEFSQHSPHPNINQFAQDIIPIIKNIRRTIRGFHFPCSSKALHNTLPPVSNSILLHNMKEKFHPMVYGARKIMATAYQSCEVLKLPLIRSKNYSGVKGVHRVGYQRGGAIRSISSVSSVLNSHYYWRKSRQESKSSECINTNPQPLIYDYGGKPFFSTSPYPTLNLFKNSGSGSKVLGVDCSGFALSSMAAAGLRVKSNRPIQAYHISGISSWKLKQQSNDLNCLIRITPAYKKPLLPGDIISTSGHVVIVDQISEDPLGLSKMKKISQCKLKNISLSQFQFSVIHSSANFNGIGIHRTHIQETTHSNLKKGLIQLTSNLCYKKFHKNVSLPSSLSISRHTLSSDCRENEVYVVGENCLSTCSY